MRVSDYSVELRFIKDEILDIGISKNPKEAEELAKEWLESIDDPTNIS